MPESITHVLMVIDKSGSMHPLADDVRGGFNTYLDDLTRDDSTYSVTVTLFDTTCTSLCTDTPIAAVPRLTGDSYDPHGWTALLDAVGRTIHTFEQRVPTLGDNDRVILVVQTDGQENSSRQYSYQQIADLIRDREKTGRWNCVYLGQHADAWGQASAMGFSQGSTISVSHTMAGTSASYTGLSRSTRSYAGGQSAAAATNILREAVDELDK